MLGFSTLRISFILYLFLGLHWDALANPSGDMAPFGIPQWRSHKTGQGDYDFSSSRPPLGEACYRATFFGDSLCAGLNVGDIFKPIRSYCENIAIHFSKITQDSPVQYINYAWSGSTSSEILNKMAKNVESISRTHVLVWDAGANDLLESANKFSHSFFKHEYCQLCSIDNELGVVGATGPDPRCKGREGSLQLLRKNITKITDLIQAHARKDAIIRQMGVYYGHYELNGNQVLNCTDPDTGTKYSNVRVTVLPVILKGLYSMMDHVSGLNTKGDKRFGTFDTFSRFNAQDPKLWELLRFIPGQTIFEYFERIFQQSDQLIDPSRQTYISDITQQEEPLIQEPHGRIDVHPTLVGHELIEVLSRPTIEAAEIPNFSRVDSHGKCE